MDGAEIKVWRRGNAHFSLPCAWKRQATRREWSARITAELEALLALRTGALGVFGLFGPSLTRDR